MTPAANRPAVFGKGETKEIEHFIEALQEAIDTGDADLFNKQFAADVLWGSPYAAIASGYEQIHAIHTTMFSAVKAVKGASKFQAEHIRFISDSVAIAYVRRLSNKEYNAPGFDELALLVLVKENNSWWLAAPQHVPDKRDFYQKTTKE